VEGAAEHSRGVSRDVAGNWSEPLEQEKPKLLNIHPGVSHRSLRRGMLLAHADFSGAPYIFSLFMGSCVSELAAESP
jgi:hypothetical protein